MLKQAVRVIWHRQMSFGIWYLISPNGKYKMAMTFVIWHFIIRHLYKRCLSPGVVWTPELLRPCRSGARWPHTFDHLFMGSGPRIPYALGVNTDRTNYETWPGCPKNARWCPRMIVRTFGERIVPTCFHHRHAKTLSFRNFASRVLDTGGTPGVILYQNVFTY